MHAGIMVVRLLAVAGMVLHLFPDLIWHIADAGLRSAARLAAATDRTAALVLSHDLHGLADLAAAAGYLVLR